MVTEVGGLLGEKYSRVEERICFEWGLLSVRIIQCAYLPHFKILLLRIPVNCRESRTFTACQRYTFNCHDSVLRRFDQRFGPHAATTKSAEYLPPCSAARCAHQFINIWSTDLHIMQTGGGVLSIVHPQYRRHHHFSNTQPHIRCPSHGRLTPPPQLIAIAYY